MPVSTQEIIYRDAADAEVATVKLCTYTVGFSCTAFEVVSPLCNLSLLSYLIIISLSCLYFFHIAEYVLTQKQGCHEVFLIIHPSPALVNTAYLSLSVRVVDILVWIHFHKYPYLQRNTWPQHPVNWFLFLPSVSSTISSPPAACFWLTAGCTR